MRAETDNHLLPPSANALEKALSLAVQLGTDILPEDIKTLWQPQEAAARFLPFIAWGLHVDFWRDTLFEQAKRNLITDSYEWHRIEGTFGAIRRICDAVFGETRVEAWYEYGGEPYGFRVLTDGELPGPEDWERLREAVWFAQALRDSLDGIEIRRTLGIGYSFAIATLTGGRQSLRPELPSMKPHPVTTGVGTCRSGKEAVGASLPRAKASNLGAGVVTLTTGFITIKEGGI